MHETKQAECAVCGKPFSYTWPQSRAKFCSKPCRQKDYATRHSEQIKEKNKRYLVEHADSRKETLRKYHAGRGKETAIKWRSQNWERLKDEIAKRYHEDPEYRAHQLSRMKANRILKNSGVKYECCGCGITEKLHCHHINENPMDNTMSNLMWLCHWCHMRIHAEGHL